MLPFGAIEGDWSDRPLYIIGGGPSLRGFDFSRLKGRKLGVNKSAWEANCDALCSLDQHFCRRSRSQIQAFVDNGGEAVLSMPSTEDGHKPINGATYVYRQRNQGLSANPTTLFGVHSGYAALNLAFLKNAREIALLGYDMHGEDKDGQTHWHGGYEWHSKRNHKFYDSFSRNFDLAARQLRESGVTVINFVGDPPSKLTEFPVRPLGDLI